MAGDPAGTSVSVCFLFHGCCVCAYDFTVCLRSARQQVSKACSLSLSRRLTSKRHILAAMSYPVQWCRHAAMQDCNRQNTLKKTVLSQRLWGQPCLCERVMGVLDERPGPNCFCAFEIFSRSAARLQSVAAIRTCGRLKEHLFKFSLPLFLSGFLLSLPPIALCPIHMSLISVLFVHFLILTVGMCWMVIDLNGSFSSLSLCLCLALSLSLSPPSLCLSLSPTLLPSHSCTPSVTAGKIKRPR